MDYNADGLMDILTGSYNPGHLYLFARKKDGSFKAGEILTNKDGEKIVVGAASTPFAIDWDGDKDTDLLVGDIRGNIWFIENNDGLQKGVKLQQGGKDIMADHGDSQPVVADWNADGIHDIVLAHGSGKVSLYAGEKAKGAPALAEPTTLIEAPPQQVRSSTGPKPGEATAEIKPGMRAKLCVTDVNADGVLDLLVGDFGSSVKPAPELTEEEQKEYEVLKAEQDENREAMMKIIESVRDKLLEKAGKTLEEMSAEEKKQFNTDYATALRADEKYIEISKKNTEIYGKIRKYVAGVEHRGNVWLFKGKAPEKKTTGN